MTHSLSVFCAHTLWIEHQTLCAAGVIANHCKDCWPHELHYCCSNMRSMLLSGRLSVISDHAMCRCQKWQVISVFPCKPAAATQVAWTTHVHGWSTRSTPCHAPGWSAAVHGSDSRRAITSMITAGEYCCTQSSNTIDRVPNESREIYFPPGKFISRELTTLIPKLLLQIKLKSNFYLSHTHSICPMNLQSSYHHLIKN